MRSPTGRPLRWVGPIGAGAVLLLAVPNPASAAPTTSAPAQLLRIAGPASGVGPFAAWASGLGDRGLHVAYTPATSSAVAQTLLRQGAVDLTVEAVDDSIQSPLNSTGMVTVPLFTSETAVVIDAADTVTGRPFAGLKADTAVLAHLYAGQTETAATELQALNPQAHLPSTLVGLTVPSDTEQTRRLTHWLASTKDSAWSEGTEDALPVATAPDVRSVADDPALIGQLDRPPTAGTGYIGYVDLDVASAAHLPVAQLPGPSGQYTSPPADNPLSNVTQAGSGDPLDAVDTLILPTVTSTSIRHSVGVLLDYAASTGQRQLPIGHRALPAPLESTAHAVAAQLLAATPTGPVPPTVTPAAGPVIGASTTSAPRTSRFHVGESPAAATAGDARPGLAGRLSGRAMAGPVNTDHLTASSLIGQLVRSDTRARTAGPLASTLVPSSLPSADAGALAAPVVHGDGGPSLAAVEPPTLAPLAFQAPPRKAANPVSAASEAAPRRESTPVGELLLVGLALLGFALASGHRPAAASRS